MFLKILDFSDINFYFNLFSFLLFFAFLGLYGVIRTDSSESHATQPSWLDLRVPASFKTLPSMPCAMVFYQP